MIGNDIIDLPAAAKESRIDRKGFLEKLFLPEEIQSIQCAADPMAATWLLWSCKEAAYKIDHRYTKERKYNPQYFACTLLQQEGSIASGTVTYGRQRCYFRSRITENYIHTYAAITPALLDEISVAISSSPDLLIQQLLPPDEFFYKDEAGIPYIHHRDNDQHTPVSLSHHGRYLGLVKMT
ncbi:4'-phosphopantetheinyl transferase family protein [Chitinophaga arvensicola]|uniref:4'-phosphopantetheinyl transferase superfamily protein n=1 Tax=Chitinophaga arvensicola TaxID=29529 RepID=A0A1I0RMV3_9BACT|nr:4'-phosphopantetheinyl transferase superfamily protein [Chitinophaga arvensicola]SEW42412.1 4'-phosphopantetheinyl transferase superfamily protein [Chitinophaga arvensicola]